jgi:hypothetical protein
VHISDTDNGPILNQYEHRQIKLLLDSSSYQYGITRELIDAPKHHREYPLFRQLYG